MQVALAQHHRRNGIAHHGVIFADGFGQVPIGGKRNAFRNTGTACPVFHLGEERFARFDIALRGFDGIGKRLLHAVQRKRLDVDALIVALLQRTAVYFARNGARELVQHQNMLRMMQLRHAAVQVIVHHVREFLRAGCRTNAALSRVDAQFFLVMRNGFGGIVGFNERHWAVTPGFIGGTEHVGITHAGDTQQHIANLCRVDVLAARDNKVFGAGIHAQQTVTVDGSAVARNEKAIGAHRLASIQVPFENARARNVQLANTIGIGAYHAGIVTRQQFKPAIEVAGNGSRSNKAGGFRHAVAGIQTHLRAHCHAQRFLVQCGAAQQHASVLADNLVVVGLQQISQNLVHHRDMGNAVAQHVVQNARRAVVLIYDKRAAA